MFRRQPLMVRLLHYLLRNLSAIRVERCLHVDASFRTTYAAAG